MCGEGWAPVCTLIPSSPPFQGPPCRLILLSSSTSFHLLGDSTGSEQGGFPGGRGPQACLHTRGPLKRPEPGGPARGGETPPMWSYIRAPCPSLSLHFRLRSRSPVRGTHAYSQSIHVPFGPPVPHCTATPSPGLEQLPVWQGRQTSSVPRIRIHALWTVAPLGAGRSRRQASLATGASPAPTAWTPCRLVNVLL